MTTRPTGFRAALAAVLVGACWAAAPHAAAQPHGPSEWADGSPLLTPAIQARITAGLAALAGTQHADGSFWEADRGRLKGGYDVRVGATAFAGLAFLAGGSVPGRGPYATQVEGALKFFLGLSAQNADGGLIAGNDDSKMHGHGTATLFLAEVYGMSTSDADREKIAPTIHRAIKFIAEAQETMRDDSLGEMGGWGYVKGDNHHEGSITVCCLQALRAARDVGFKVPTHVLIKAIRYLIASQNEDGSFTYRINYGESHSTLPLTAAAISTLNAFGVYDATATKVLGEDLPQLSECMRKGLAFLDQSMFDDDTLRTDTYYAQFFYYAHFYGSQAYYKSRFPQGRQWARYYQRVCTLLFDERYRHVGVDGFWNDAVYGRPYATANATLVLQIESRYLPIFQR